MVRGLERLRDAAGRGGHAHDPAAGLSARPRSRSTCSTTTSRAIAERLLADGPGCSAPRSSACAPPPARSPRLDRSVLAPGGAAAARRRPRGDRCARRQRRRSGRRRAWRPLVPAGGRRAGRRRAGARRLAAAGDDGRRDDAARSARSAGVPGEATLTIAGADAELRGTACRPAARTTTTRRGWPTRAGAWCRWAPSGSARDGSVDVAHAGRRRRRALPPRRRLAGARRRRPGALGDVGDAGPALAAPPPGRRGTGARRARPRPLRGHAHTYTPYRYLTRATSGVTVRLIIYPHPVSIPGGRRTIQTRTERTSTP